MSHLTSTLPQPADAFAVISANMGVLPWKSWTTRDAGRSCETCSARSFC